MESSRAELQEKIKAQGDIVRKLKAEKAEKNLVRMIRFDAIWILAYIFHHMYLDDFDEFLNFQKSNTLLLFNANCRTFPHWQATSKA